MIVAVVSHAGKTFGGGLNELRKVLAEAGYGEPLWYEVPKSRDAPKAVHRAVNEGAELVFVWGGDGMVQRCIDALSGSDVPIAILPAGTGNLLATNLGIPKNVAKAVEIGLIGTRRKLDLGVMNGERFAAMAGTGFDAIMVHDTDRAEKERLGRVAYFRSSLKAMRAKSVRMRIRLERRSVVHRQGELCPNREYWHGNGRARGICRGIPHGWAARPRGGHRKERMAMGKGLLRDGGGSERRISLHRESARQEDRHQDETQAAL